VNLSTMRYCPRCGNVTDQASCPKDGTPTVRRVEGERRGLTKGDVIGGRYRIVGELGRGGFGTVFDAVHATTGHSVAVKVMTPMGSDDGEEASRRFFQEASATSKLSHPNTVRVYDFGQTDGGDLFLAMERLTGETLQALLQRLAAAGQAMSEQQAVEIANDVLRSLGEAHAHGLVHRDLKPANVFLHTIPGGEQVVKVLDFGIAKDADAGMTQAGKALGTPTHMSPEQALGKPVDGRTDLYALGILLFECLAGELPYWADSPLAVVMKHVTEQVPSLAVRTQGRVRPALAGVVEKAMAKEPGDRWQNALEMRAALQAALGQPAPDTGHYRVSPQPPVVQPSLAQPMVQPAASQAVRPQPAEVPQAVVRPAAQVAVAASQPVSDDFSETAYMSPAEVFGQVSRSQAQIAAPHEEDNDSFIEVAASEEPDEPAPVSWRPPPIRDVRHDLHGASSMRNPLGAMPLPGRPLPGGLTPDRMFAEMQQQMQAQLQRAMPTVARGVSATLTALAVSQHGRQALLAQQDGHVRLVDLEIDGSGATSALLARHQIDVGQAAGLVTSVLPTPEGRLVVTGSEQGELRLWDAGLSACVRELDLEVAITALALSTDAKLLVVGCSDGSACLIDFPELTLRRTLRGHREAVTAVAASGSRRLVVTAGEDGMVRTWDPVGGGARLSMRGHDGAIGAVAISANGQLVVSGGWDGRLLGWGTRSGEQLLEVAAHADVVAGIALDQTGNTVATASDDRTARVWQVHSGSLLAERRDLVAGAKCVGFADEARAVVVGAWDGMFYRLGW
jgi:serine/threonine protein kinase